MSDRLDQIIDAAIADINAAPDDASFSELVEIASRNGSFDKAKHARFADWAGIGFAGADLSGFDFTGGILHGCDFAGARLVGNVGSPLGLLLAITKPAQFVRLDQAELGRVIHRPYRDPHAPAELTPVANPRAAADWNDYVKAWRGSPRPASDAHLGVGAIFQDAPFAPEMVVVPAGSFMMGDMGDQVETAMPVPFAIGRFTLTFDEWDAAQAHPDWKTHSGIAPRNANDHSCGRGKQPAIDVSWEDAKAYCAWLSKVTSKAYRLPTEAEWEYCCRAGTSTEFWWGDEISTEQANYNGNYTFGKGEKGEYRQRTVPVYRFDPNPWGLHQVHGNVWEWCEDKHDASSSSRVLRGGSWFSNPDGLRSADRSNDHPDYRDNGIGFRVARTLLRPTP